MSAAGIPVSTDLRGASVIVTGAAGGVGSAIVDALLNCGTHVIGVDRAEVAGQEREGLHPVVGDVAEEATVTEAFDVAVRATSRLVGLVTCTIAQHRVPLRDAGPGDLMTAFEVMTIAAWRWGIELVKRLDGRPGASIVHVSSVHGDRPDPGFGPYAVAKAGLQSLTRSMAVEWGSLGIRCNAVLPGFVQVPRNHSVWRDPDALARIADRTPLRRPVLPDEVAATVRFLLSSESSGVTGTSIPVDGGVLARLGLGDA